MLPDELKITDKITTDRVRWPGLAERRVEVDTLRLDKIHPIVSGNKWFKLKPHLQAALTGGNKRLITFGGAWSNHIVATAYAAAEAGFSSTGIIRGEKPRDLSATLQAASGYGMDLQFISRGDYTRKTEPAFLDTLSATYPGSYIIPEGGSGTPGIQGSEEILALTDRSHYSHILCAIGTGTTWQGIVRASLPGQWVIGVSVLKGGDHYLANNSTNLSPEKLAFCRIWSDYHFGGYGRHTPALLDFMNRFYHSAGIPTDFVYTGKLFHAVMDMIHKDFFPPGSRLLIIHSGGLQGNGSFAPGVLDF
jgi:1-aminocyclopropane-1-carboxylate deaminase